MNPIHLLVIEKVNTVGDRLRNLLTSNEFHITTVHSLEEADTFLQGCPQDNPVGIILICVFEEPWEAFVQGLRRRFSLTPIQLLVARKSWEGFLLESGIDDIFQIPISDEELVVRVRVAGFRYQRQVQLVEEREFFRKAVKQEEELAAQIMDQNRKLKRAFEDIERINEELVRANRELERIARHDALSGLLNRITLFNAVDAEIERSLRTGSPLSGIMIDIDHFKDINDNYGHQCGDDVIRMIGSWLLGNLRKYDLAGRYGGEEFFVVLPNTRLNHAVKIAERFRKTVQTHSISCDSHSIQITASLGVAEYRMGETRDMWINRCDRAMYVAKHRGRNQVVADTFPLGPAGRLGR
ncbi:MAG: diguanylate cyclase [Spirochaetes bacterium]|nr:diguanylate cyclase [Spirochaetota bacterium]